MDMKARATSGHASADGRETHYVTLSFVAPQAEARPERLPAHVGLALDRSGSMDGRKLKLARQAVDTSLRMLRATDRFALVVFDAKVETLAESTLATAGALERAQAALARTAARGMTNLCAGWLQAAELALEQLEPGGRGRVIVTTDGQANQGTTAVDELLELAAALRARGMATSTFGIGNDFNEVLLQGMAERGGGHFYYVESAEQIVDMLAGEIGETLEVVLRDACVDVRIPAGTSVTLLERFAHTHSGDVLRVALDDLTSAQRVQMCFELRLPPADVGRTIALEFELRAGSEESAVASTRVEWRYASEEDAAAAPRDADVEAEAARVLSSRMQDEALASNRAGRYEEARRVVSGLAAKLGALGRDNPRVREILAGVEREEQVLSAPMEARDSKRRYFEAQAALRSRDPLGKARRSPE